MKASIAIILGSLFASQNALAFVPVRNAHQRTLIRAAELKPEPEGGEELNKFSFSLPDSRVKNLGPDGGEGVYKFWLAAKADGKTIKKLRDQTEREASKKANFPGFRKVGVITRPVEISKLQCGSRQFLCSIPFSILFNAHNFHWLGPSSAVCPTSDDGLCCSRSHYQNM
jgi:hypothetical protein